MNNFDLNTYLASKRKQINDMLENILDPVTNSSRVFAAMRYSLTAGGKRVRPILCIAAAEAVGGMGDEIMPAACALEMIHTYSLIHDDLPAMDNDELRRGQPTCHIAFDEATAILAGDALLTLAFETLSKIDMSKINNPLKLLRVVNKIALAVGYKGMIEGQMKDMSSEGMLLELEDLKKMHAQKTGALIEASIFSGAVLGNGSPEHIEKLGIYAQNIGLAFQVTDDILNVEGDPLVMGKNVGTDEFRDKNTYPALIGTDESKKMAQKLANNSLQALDYFDSKADPLRYIANYVIARKR